MYCCLASAIWRTVRAGTHLRLPPRWRIYRPRDAQAARSESSIRLAATPCSKANTCIGSPQCLGQRADDLACSNVSLC